ncbi:MAG TPA: sulfotransferase domain-containing protein [Chitinophagaceae bacterium]|nr:sulfotransferase domain-containing protein [Chitinophagaceae bacterium]
MSNAVLPNTFIIGVQKAGTTTLDDWLSQHPQIYCYESLKDIHLFARFKTREEIEQRLKKEPALYKNQPVILQSAVNYIFYPQLLAGIAQFNQKAKLILILRNPVDRALSSYAYFKKMLRETRPIEEALLYQPGQITEFTKDNSDFTYIEHGFYAKQIKSCFEYFSKDQLLILDYDDLVKNASSLLQKIFSFLNIDASFQPDLRAKNITGSLRNQFLQERIIKRGQVRKWVVDNLVDPFFPVAKRKKLKRKLFEINTGKVKKMQSLQETDKQTIEQIRKQLESYFCEDAKELDAMLGTRFSEKWFGDGV